MNLHFIENCGIKDDGYVVNPQLIESSGGYNPIFSATPGAWAERQFKLKSGLDRDTKCVWFFFIFVL